jgi:hypothetical protein
LPVRSNLNTRGINCNPLCPRCHEKIEDVNHAFIGCVWAKQVWFASPLTFDLISQHLQISLNGLKSLFRKCTRKGVS